MSQMHQLSIILRNFRSFTAPSKKVTATFTSVPHKNIQYNNKTAVPSLTARKCLILSYLNRKLFRRNKKYPRISYNGWWLHSLVECITIEPINTYYFETQNRKFFNYSLNFSTRQRKHFDSVKCEIFQYLLY